MESKSIKSSAWSLICIMLYQILHPVAVHAGGPDQPEIHSFTPLGVSDMVDPFTGDFKYNIPLMDVDGYPINIAYNSGINMQQEASWVGLGWSLNTGAVVRNMAGLPDDFDGDEIVKEEYMKPNKTISVEFGLSNEIVGFSGLSLGATVKAKYNNYTGIGIDLGLSASMSLSLSQVGLSGGLALNGSSENGASFTPSLGISIAQKNKDVGNLKLGASISSTYNSRSGLQGVSYGYSLSAKSNVNDMAKDVSIGGRTGSFLTGSQTYSPGSGHNRKSVSFNGTVNAGVTAFAVDPSFSVGVMFADERIDQTTISNPSFGYFNLENGQRNSKAILDFNRNNDGLFAKTTPFLPSTFLTQDVFNIQAQGSSGNFRAFRNDVGFVFDPETISTSENVDIGFELGAGNIADFGVDLVTNSSESRKGLWDNLNPIQSQFGFEREVSGKFKNYSFQEAAEIATETDFTIPNNYVGVYPQKFTDLKIGRSASLLNILKPSNTIVTSNNRVAKIKSNNHFSFLSVGEVRDGLGVNSYQGYSSALNHHIGEITNLGMDGRRYVFGLPLYNKIQEDITFSIGNGLYTFDGIGFGDDYSGLVSGITDNLMSVSNNKGIDNYYSMSQTPAYSHSHMLTAVLSDDYVDSENSGTNKGPSKNDLGTYIKFDYKPAIDFNWRNPIQEQTAMRNKGKRADKTDDKASVIYGEKQLTYLSKMETKNYVAVFYSSNRDDAKSISGRNGNYTGVSMQKLDKICLYTKTEFDRSQILGAPEAVPLQQVNFKYNYTLCSNYPMNSNPINGTGKLTLESISFAYQGSNRMTKSAYTFEYGFNPDYKQEAIDCWGTYKPSSSGLNPEVLTFNSLGLPNDEFPYAIQNAVQANENSGAWNLTKINLPSGGSINVTYESDDYAFVQNRPAMRMMPIVATQNTISGLNTTSADHQMSLDGNKILVVKLDGPMSDAQKPQIGYFIYFKCLTYCRIDKFTLIGDTKIPDINDIDAYEFIKGYAPVVKSEVVSEAGSYYLKIELSGTSILDNGSSDYSPITKQAIQFSKMNLSQYINASVDGSGIESPTAQVLIDYANALVGAVSSFTELVTGPSQQYYNKGMGRTIIKEKSFLRVEEPTHRKFGGGCRVKSIKMNDNWQSASGGSDDFSYGQEYSYDLEDGTSSGVATYEPMIGGDQNPWRQAIPYENKILWAPNEELFYETPIMESQFPSASVGYSRVTIKDLVRTNNSGSVIVSRTATGKIVKEFYTCKDFPTRVRATNIDPIPIESTSVKKFTWQKLCASQGFTIELNDMHGKEKSEKVYSQGVTEPISQVDHLYQSQTNAFTSPFGSLVSNTILDNCVSTINSNGSISTATLGVKYDVVADFRNDFTRSISKTKAVNSNLVVIPFVPAPIYLITFFPKRTENEMEFNSATLNKVVQRFGIQSGTRANQDGSIVETKNLAYDAETGEVLVTKTTTNFDDAVYSTSYPAYWKYDQLGQAYKNQGLMITANLNANGYAALPDADTYFVEGDEVAVNSTKGWITAVTNSGIYILDKTGVPISASNAKIKVLRSGRKNKQNTKMATLTSLTNPLLSLTSNSYSNVLNAGAVEFSQDWKTFCDCFTENPTTNPHVLGVKGNWRPIKSFTHLTDRTRSNDINNSISNTNIRKDGVFKSYSPYYKNVNGNWMISPDNWTFVSQVTNFSPNGQTLETRDALGRYSSSLFGFKNTLTTGVAANSKFSEFGSLSFEDNGQSNCQDNHLVLSNGTIQTSTAHSGRTSIKVTPTNTASQVFLPLACENSSCTIALNGYTLGTPYLPAGYSIINGTVPYELVLDQSNGFIDAYINASNELKITSSSAIVSAKITIIDKAGCVLKFKVIKTSTGSLTVNNI